MADNTGTKDATYNLVSVCIMPSKGQTSTRPMPAMLVAIRISPVSSARFNSRRSSGPTAPSNSWPSVSSRAARPDGAGPSGSIRSYPP